MIAPHTVEHDYVKQRHRRALFIKTTHMKALHIWASIYYIVDRSRIVMEGKDDWLVCGKVFDECGSIHTMRKELSCK